MILKHYFWGGGKKLLKRLNAKLLKRLHSTITKDTLENPDVSGRLEIVLKMITMFQDREGNTLHTPCSLTMK